MGSLDEEASLCEALRLETAPRQGSELVDRMQTPWGGFGRPRLRGLHRRLLAAGMHTATASCTMLPHESRRPPDVGATTALWSEPELVETMHSGGAPLELRCMGAIAAPAPIESVLEPALMRCTALILILSFGIPGVPGDRAAGEGSATLMR